MVKNSLVIVGAELWFNLEKGYKKARLETQLMVSGA